MEPGVMTYRLMPHSATGFSPFKMLYGRESTTTPEAGKPIYVPNTSYGHADREHAREMGSLFGNPGPNLHQYWRSLREYIMSG